ncbi:MAG: hypothetical protein V3R40_05560 [Gammaproteobacteria bacterium]
MAAIEVLRREKSPLVQDLHWPDVDQFEIAAWLSSDFSLWL